MKNQREKIENFIFTTLFFLSLASIILTPFVLAVLTYLMVTYPGVYCQ